jgi:hypothetical protein
MHKLAWGDSNPAESVAFANPNQLLDTECSILDRYPVPQDSCLTLSSIQHPESSICPFSTPRPFEPFFLKRTALQALFFTQFAAKPS